MSLKRILVALAAMAATQVVAAPANGFDPLEDFTTIHKRGPPGKSNPSKGNPGKGHGKGHGHGHDGDYETCDTYGAAPATKAPKANVWGPITPADNAAVWDLLHADASLNLTDPSKAVLTDNYVFWIDTLHTNKTDVLPYLEGTGEAPPKYARAIIFRGGIAEPDSMEFMVGPLPVGPETKISPLDYIYNGGRGGSVPFNGRYFDSVRSAATEPLLVSVMSDVADITEQLIGGVFYGGSDKRTTLTSTTGTPMSYNGTTTYRTVMFRNPGPATYLTPLDLFVLLDCPGTDPSHFKLKGLVTNQRFFPTVAEFRAAYEKGELKREFVQEREPEWALVKNTPEMGTRALEERFAPQTLEIGGKRYKFDEAEKYVEYMGWSFYLSFTRTLGVMLYDIKFKGESVIYELSLQEAAAQYAGHSPKSAATVYHDTYYSLGTDVATLVEGFDCPYGSTFLPITYYSGNKQVTHPNAICIFEADIGIPISRHRTGGNNDYGFQNIGTVKGTALTVRSIATIGNYDYMFDYQFHLEGSMEVHVRASGYLQSSYYYPAEGGKFGPRVQVATEGSLHDHILTYKADFDVVGTKNSLEVSEIVLVNQTQEWYPELGSFEQMQLNISTMQTEQQFNWAPNGGKMFCVVNENEKNRWGEKRGYRIVPGKSNIHLSPMNSPFSKHQSPFAKSHLAVTVQHDNEPYANSVQNVNLPSAPQQDFLKFFDDESIVNEDIVMWFNLGMHHFTRAEDIPVTLYTDAHSSIMFAPQNFFDRAQDGDLQNRRWVVPDAETGELEYETHGIEMPTCAVELTEPVLSIEKFTSV
ncbi:uncharacterized protein DNG_09787 [Cephalotrichum gorgonifer]|uniref:Amine oxidase n=1 Tax=Cephalotrichum gorgonifer TaxID=2041049 RepID=A0AAE8SZR7_9PEZI|nr:uncharacterized protein DNG_09787 [Cephalotrichum gorgonifer]